MPTSTYLYITRVGVCAQDLDVACTHSAPPRPSPATSPDCHRLNGRTYPITYVRVPIYTSYTRVFILHNIYMYNVLRGRGQCARDGRRRNNTKRVHKSHRGGFER